MKLLSRLFGAAVLSGCLLVGGISASADEVAGDDEAPATELVKGDDAKEKDKDKDGKKGKGKKGKGKGKKGKGKGKDDKKPAEV